jgi:hypothetical protein
VGRRVEIEDLGQWGERTPRTRIVTIGRSIDPEELGGKFESCIALQ